MKKERGSHSGRVWGIQVEKGNKKALADILVLVRVSAHFAPSFVVVVGKNII